jgi:hypothetical protein
MKDAFYDLLNRARADLAEARQALEAARRDAQHYAPDDPDPYGPDAAALHDTLERAQRRYAELARRRRALLGQKPELTEGRLARLGLARLQEMRHWHRFRGQARALLADVAAVHEAAEQALQLVDKLDHKPLEVAQRCRQWRGHGQETLQLADELARDGLHGADCKGVYDEIRRLIAALEGVPDHFWAGSDQRVLALATKEGTVQAWQVAESVVGPLREQHRTLKEWQAALHQLAGAIRENGALLDRIEGDMAGIPAEGEYAVAGAAYQRRLDQLRQEAGDIGGPTAARTPQELVEHTVACSHLMDRARALDGDVGGTLQRWQEELQPLVRAIQEGQALLARIEDKMVDAARAQAYPVAWGVYQERLGQLQLWMQERIGEPDAPRTPQQVSQTFGVCQQLQTRARALEGEVVQVLALREALIPLLDQPGFAEPPAWQVQAEQLDPEVRRYPLTNWPGELQVESFRVDAQNLRQAVRRWVPSRQDMRLLAVEIERQQAEVERLVVEVELYRQRLRQIAAILEEIKKQEPVIHGELEAAQQAMGRLVQQANSARPPLDYALREYQSKLLEVRNDCSQLIRDFSRGRGSFDSKLEHIEKRRQVHLPVLQAFEDALQEERKAKRTELQQEVDLLLDVAPFAGERAMDEAAQLLKALAARHLPSLGRASSSTRVTRLAEGVGSLLEEREALYRSLEDVRSGISNRVLELSQRAQEMQQAAYARYEELARQVKAAQADGLHVSSDLGQVQRLLEGADRDTEQLKRKGRTVREVRGRLERITEAYQAAMSKAEIQQAKLRQDRLR